MRPRAAALMMRIILASPWEGQRGEYTHNMDYSVGSRIRVRLYSGKVVEAEITAITNQSTGRKLQIVYGNVTASINPAQITEVLE